VTAGVDDAVDDRGVAEAALPVQLDRTRRFTLGVPRSAVVGRGDGGGRVLFLRSDAGDDPVTHLWVHEVGPGTTARLVDARTLGVDATATTAEERDRRERARELAEGITTFSTDREVTAVAFALGGRLFTLSVAGGRPVEHDVGAPVFDPRMAPDASAVAVHADGGLVVLGLPDGPDAPGVVRGRLQEEGVAWGRAEFIAAEEMGRVRGIWWAADSARLVVARVDERDVPTWWIGDATDPSVAARPVRYPAAGTTNARVSLAVVDAVDLRRTTVALGEGDEYVAAVHTAAGPITVLLQRRDQRRARVVVVDPVDGTTREVRTLEDDAWIELVPGAPAWMGERLVTVEDDPAPAGVGTRRLCIDGRAVTPPGLQVREVIGAGPAGVVVSVSAQDPMVIGPAIVRQVDGVWTLQGPGATSGVVRWVVGPEGPDGPRLELCVGTDRTLPTITVHAPSGRGGPSSTPLEVVAERPVIDPAPQLITVTQRHLAAALLLPSDATTGARLPVLLDPYGGPHAQRVLAAGSAYLTSQWFADRGFAVLVVDGRGTPGRGPVWERAVHGDLAAPVLEDQLDALAETVRLDPRLDPSRVAIRGWSFGGYLAALAVLRRPDVVHAAIAGAPVTDWRLYDTHYTERYLGDPRQDDAPYRRSSLVDADGRLVGAAPWGPRPPSLMIVHGLADDNVVAAHALRLSRALFLDGRPHRFLPLPGVSHVATGADVTTRLLELELAFLRESLGRT
jgi:dipeptidyl-peptidase 4